MMVNKTHSAGELVKVAQRLLTKELRDLTRRGIAKKEKSSRMLNGDLALTIVEALLMDHKSPKSGGPGKSRPA